MTWMYGWWSEELMKTDLMTDMMVSTQLEVPVVIIQRNEETSSMFQALSRRRFSHANMLSQKRNPDYTTRGFASSTNFSSRLSMRNTHRERLGDKERCCTTIQEASPCKFEEGGSNPLSSSTLPSMKWMCSTSFQPLLHERAFLWLRYSLCMFFLFIERYRRASFSSQSASESWRWILWLQSYSEWECIWFVFHLNPFSANEGNAYQFQLRRVLAFHSYFTSFWENDGEICFLLWLFPC